MTTGDGSDLGFVNQVLKIGYDRHTCDGFQEIVDANGGFGGLGCAWVNTIVVQFSAFRGINNGLVSCQGDCKG